MNLKKVLKDQGYDLIDGPVRNHKPLQLWLKRAMEPAELYYEHVSHAFQSTVSLQETESPALNVNAGVKDEFSFNIGLTLLQNVLKSIGLGAFDLSLHLKHGRNLSIAYDNAISKEYATGPVSNYFSSADFLHPNPDLLQNANRNNILIVTGLVLAKNLVAEISTELDISLELVAKLNQVADGKIQFNLGTARQLKMVSQGNFHFPIAVKASRLDYDKGEFKKLELVTDSANYF